MSKLYGLIRQALPLGLAAVFSPNPSTLAADPWADEVVSYVPGAGALAGYDNPIAALGSPERYTGEGIYPSAVTPFNAPFGTDEIVSIGAGGRLTVRFDQPITDDPSHLHGVDLLVFGNGFFEDLSWPSGIVNGLFAEGPFELWLSDDGVNFVPLPGPFFDSFLPTLGYADLTNPYSTVPGAVWTDFTRPPDPNLSITDFLGLSFADVLALYDGSGGGIPIDISATGLSSASYVQVRGLDGKFEIDAFVAVPEPSSLAGLLVLLPFVVGRAAQLRARHAS